MKVKNKFRKAFVALIALAVVLVVWCSLSLEKIGDSDEVRTMGGVGRLSECTFIILCVQIYYNL